MMKVQTILAGAVLLSAVASVSCSQDTAAYHYKKIKRHESYMSNPENYEESQGFKYASSGIDIGVHYEALAAKGELGKVTYTFPKLTNTRENTMKWVKFAGMQQTPFDAVADGSAGSGTAVLEFTFWFQPTQQNSVDQFIDSYKSDVNKRVH